MECISLAITSYVCLPYTLRQASAANSRCKSFELIQWTVFPNKLL